MSNFACPAAEFPFVHEATAAMDRPNTPLPYGNISDTI